MNDGSPGCNTHDVPVEATKKNHLIAQHERKVVSRLAEELVSPAFNKA